MKKPITKKKPMTLEDFAVVIQKDLSRMATKDDLATFATKDHLTEGLWPIQRDLKTLTSQLKEAREDVKQITGSMVSKADLADTLGEELAKSAYARQLNELRNRVNVIEEKLGIKSTRQAA